MADPVLCLQQDASELAAGDGEECLKAPVFEYPIRYPEQPIGSAGTLAIRHPGQAGDADSD
jgi:hypothetical protein